MPFPKDSPLHRYYPNGFTDGSGSPEYFLNAMYRDLPLQVPKDVLGETDDLGADALKLSVGAALGVKVDYYVLINLRGFTKLINALGGIKVNVNTYIPIGGDSDSGVAPDEQISPGANKKLKGREALWFARGRYGSDDYARMERQRCVVNAIIRQANPANVFARYEDIAKAGKQIVKTDMPQEVLPLIVDLSLRVKDGNLRSIVFKNGVNGFSTVTPDWDQVRGRVKIAFGETKKIKSSTDKPTAAAPRSRPPGPRRPSPRTSTPAVPGNPTWPPGPGPSPERVRPSDLVPADRHGQLRHRHDDHVVQPPVQLATPAPRVLELRHRWLLAVLRHHEALDVEDVALVSGAYADVGDPVQAAQVVLDLSDHRMWLGVVERGGAYVGQVEDRGAQVLHSVGKDRQ